MTDKMTMTFETFQGSRQPCADLADAIQSDNWAGETRKAKGFLYLGAFYIEEVQDWWPVEAQKQGKWHLMIGRVGWISDDLAMLERKLYEFAKSEEYLTEELDALIAEYQAWEARNGLKLGSADEHRFDEDLTEEQRAYIWSFCDRWDAAAEREVI
jgi:hypothetical protein